MTNVSQNPESRKPLTMDEARARFEERFPELQNKARTYFGDYSPEAKDEAVANSLFLTWHHFTSVVRNGKADDTLLTSTFYYSCRQTRAGRMMRTVKRGHFRELFDYARRSGHVIIRGVDLDAFVSRRATVLDIVAFRIDTRDWLDSLTDHQRARAIDLAEGWSTSECAERWNVSEAAVSLYRRQLNRSYERFVSR
jgi:DNA-directed RNA polymerase specialized sigma24 family protein